MYTIFIFSSSITAHHINIYTALVQKYQFIAASNQYAEPEEQQEVIEAEAISEEQWGDNNWNKYKMKELVTETVRQAGDTALRTTASDL